MKKTMFAMVSFEFEGVHHWPAAEGAEQFLENPHRHMFKCRVWVEQMHNDRDVEYIKLKRALVGQFGKFREGTFSCEMVAEEIIAWVRIQFAAKYHDIKVEVTEDGENGALIEETDTDSNPNP